MKTNEASRIGGTAQARHEVVHEQLAPLLSLMTRMEAQVRRDPPKDRDGAEDRSLAFAAASLRALVLEAGSEAWDDPMGEGEAENMLFAEIGDDAPSSYDYEMIPTASGSRLEGVGERQQRYNVGLKRIGTMMEAVVHDLPAFRSQLRKRLEQIALRSPVRSIEEAKRRIAVRMPSGQTASLDTHAFGVAQPAPLVAEPKMTKAAQRIADKAEKAKVYSIAATPSWAERRRPSTVTVKPEYEFPAQMNLFG